MVSARSDVSWGMPQWAEEVGALEDMSLCDVRTVVLATKAAYQFRHPRWLALLSRAMELIERCPVEWQASLKQELSTFQPHWTGRPVSGRGQPPAIRLARKA